jgi:DNA polymerase elongation subunit (family B)
MAWRNVSYDSRNQSIHLWTWDSNGNRIKLETSYEPYLYIESSQGTDGVSIYNTPLKKLKFKNQFERNKYVNDTPIRRLFHNISCEQEFLLTTFKDEIDSPDFGKHPLKVYFFDIETYSTKGFPEPEKAEDPINLITIYNTLDQKFYTWGSKKYTPKENNVVYFYCKNETELLKEFIKFWKKDPPDMLVGWNSAKFDIPYIMNRINKILGEEESSNLSPINQIFYRENIGIDKFGKVINKWYIKGISLIDYMDTYVAFSRGDRESYSLGYIGQYELGETKVNVGATSLSSLSESDWEKFVDYNIQDVRLLVKLDDKLKYINLIRNLSYKGFIQFEQSLKKVSMITGAMANQASKENLIMPTFKTEETSTNYEGGYVHEPERGISKCVVSYDANSLYPNTIISLNVSPETKVGKILSIDNKEYTIRLSNGKIVTLEEEKFKKLVQREELSISKYNVLYTQKFKGVVPKFIDTLYKQRVEAKDKMILLKKESKKVKDKNLLNRIEEKILDLDTIQNVYKLILNSIYGVFGQKYSPLYDIDHAASITLTGQSVVKQAPEIVFEYAKTKGVECKKEDIYKYGDTDSAYFSFKPILDHFNLNLVESDGFISKDSKKIIKEVGNFLNEEIIKWAKFEINSKDPRFVFKQEAICDLAVFMERKRYILHVLELEGVTPDKPFKYTGVEVVRSSFSEPVKKLIKNVIESAILSQNKKDSDKILKEAYEDFKKLPIFDICFRSNISDIVKYEKRITDDGKTGKGTPVHTKGAIRYNKMIKEFGLESKYEKIGSGTKMKWFYPAKNVYNFDSMAYLDNFPSEFEEIFKVDYKKMFEKIVLPPIERLYDCIGWNLPNIVQETYTDLFDFFSN